MKIQLSADAGVEDDMFFYCDSFDDLLSLTDFGGEDFVMTECFGFEAFTEKRKISKEELEKELDKYVY